MALAKNEEIELTIEALSSDGNGIGRHNGQAVFVPASAPGDRLAVKIVKAKSTYAYGRIQQILSPGPGRIAEDCPVFRQCGGCTFRHLSYATELEAKQKFVEDAVAHIGRFETRLEPILPSPQENRYRNKVQYPVQAAGSGGLQYGFYARHSHRIVQNPNCLLQPALVNTIAQAAAGLLQQLGIAPYNEATQTGYIRHLYLRRSESTGQVMLCLVSKSGALPRLERLKELLLARCPEISTLVLNINPGNTNVICGEKSIVLHGEGYIREEIRGVPLRIGPQSFCQVNTLGAERLFALAEEYAAPTPTLNLLDLYCGAGVIGLSMAGRCQSLTGIDITAEAIESAKWSAGQMGLGGKARFLCGDAEKLSADLLAGGFRPNVLILDPPRKGCSPKTLETARAFGPDKIVMVSCNPATMARDVALLAANGPYRPVKIRPVDMFPRTPHVECVVLLSKVGL